MKDNRETIQNWADTWNKAHIALRSIKSIEMSKESYLFDSLTSLSEIFNYALAHSVPSETSGLVEMQKYFAKLRTK